MQATQEQINQQFIRACIAKDLPKAKELLDDGTDGVKVDINQKTLSALNLAAEMNSTEFLSYLLTHPKYKKQFGTQDRILNAFNTACCWGNTDSIRYFMTSHDLKPNRAFEGKGGSHLTQLPFEATSSGMRTLFEENHQGAIDFLFEVADTEWKKNSLYNCAINYALPRNHLDLCAHVLGKNNEVGAIRTFDLNEYTQEIKSIIEADNAEALDFLFHVNEADFVSKYNNLDCLQAASFHKNKNMVLTVICEYNSVNCLNMLFDNQYGKTRISPADINFNLFYKAIEQNSYQVIFSLIERHDWLEKEQQKIIKATQKIIKDGPLYNLDIFKVKIEMCEKIMIAFEKQTLNQSIVKLPKEKISLKNTTTLNSSNSSGRALHKI